MGERLLKGYYSVELSEGDLDRRCRYSALRQEH